MAKLPLVLCATAATIVAGLFAWKAEATPVTGAAHSLAVIQSYSQVQKVGCIFGTSRCPAGTKWVCTALKGGGKQCACRPC